MQPYNLQRQVMIFVGKMQVSYVHGTPDNALSAFDGTILLDDLYIFNV
jgi:hypothetical protein